MRNPIRDIAPTDHDEARQPLACRSLDIARSQMLAKGLRPADGKSAPQHLAAFSILTPRCTRQCLGTRVVG